MEPRQRHVAGRDQGCGQAGLWGQESVRSGWGLTPEVDRDPDIPVWWDTPGRFTDETRSEWQEDRESWEAERPCGEDVGTWAEWPFSS